MVERKLKRRDFLKLSAMGALGATVAACTAPSPTAPAATQTPVVIEKIVEKEVQVTQQVEVEKQVLVTVEVPPERTEPPMLADKVASGALPPVDERLPETPYVVGGRDAIGVYGGEIRMIHNDPVWMVSNYDLNTERMLQYSDVDLKTIVPNTLESYEMSADGREWTFRMRKGMKWSDGMPITTEDIRFWWEDMRTYPELSAAPAWQFRFGGENMKVDIIDDFTFKFTFKAPFGNFAAHMTRWHENSSEIFFPSHFLKKYHNKYATKEELDAAVAEAGAENWVQVFNNWSGWGMGTWQGPKGVVNYPVNCAWRIVDNPQEGLYLWERNPYYWKVDLAGNQLPYIDTKRYDYVQTTDSTKLKLVQGEIDILGQHDVTMNSYPYYKENETKGNYKVGDYISCMIDRYVLFPQHYLADDPVLTEIVNKPEWVKALSVAIDRAEVNETLFFGLARVGGMAPMPTSKYYKPAYGDAWAQYDPDLANQLLDSIGLDKRDNEGFRLRPDGQRLSYQIEHCGIRVGESTGKYTEMVTTYWREIGIEATTKEITESLYNERMTAYQVHCGIWHADRCTDMLLHIEPQWFIPTGGGGQGSACVAWSTWYQAANKEAEGLVEPPEHIKALTNYFDQMTSVISEDERVALGQKIFDWLAENPLEIGLVLECPTPLLFNKNMRNLPRPKAVVGWDTWGLSTYHPEAFFYEGGMRA
jgi:peptide/nickel transport system substrate-binding protein